MFANKGLNTRIEFYHAPIAGRLKGVFGAQYQTQKSSAGRLYAVPVPEDSTRGYHLVNAGIRYKNRIGKADYTLSLDGNNLLNQKIYIHNSYLPYVPQMGCNFIFAVNVKF